VPGTSLDDVLLVNPSRVRPATADEVSAAESELGTPLPPEYVDYVRRLGEGSLGHFVGVEGPAGLGKASKGFRERAAQYWFWDTSETGVTPESLQQQGILLASSFDGDELCLDPSGLLVVLPRNEDVATAVGPGFLDALDWMLSGHLNPWVEGWTFEADVARVRQHPPLPASLGLAEAAQRLAALQEHSHVVDLGERQTFFLPAVQGRLSLYELVDEPLEMDLSHDEDADPAEMARLLSVVGAG
jgi:hypothetical protein